MKPVALAQCRNFLANHPDMKAVEAEDTAGSAEYISNNNIRGWAAICSSYALKFPYSFYIQQKVFLHIQI